MPEPAAVTHGESRFRTLAYPTRPDPKANEQSRYLAVNTGEFYHLWSRDTGT